jgi:hypothetical protein
MKVGGYDEVDYRHLFKPAVKMIITVGSYMQKSIFAGL